MTYATTQDHLLAELDRLSALLEHYRDAEAGGHAGADASESGPVRSPAALSLALPEGARADLAEKRATIDRRCGESDDATLRLRVLADRFALSRNHLDVLLAAAAPDFDDAFEERFAAIQGDRALTQPTVGLVEDLFARSERDRLVAFGLVGPDSPLRRHGFLELGEAAGTGNSRRRRPLRVTDRCLDYLKGVGGVDPALDGVADLVTPALGVDELRLEPDTRDRVAALRDERDGPPAVRYFHGPDGAGKRRTVEALAQEPLLRADLDRLLVADALDRFVREALLQDCPVHLTGVTGATADAGGSSSGVPGDRLTLAAVVDALSGLERDLYLTGTDRWTPAAGAVTGRFTVVAFPAPGVEGRRECWADHAATLPETVDPTTLASTFALTQGDIDDAVATARALTDGETLTREAVVEGCKAQSARGLTDLAERIEPRADWDDIVLPPASERQLSAVAAHVRHRGTVYEEWGFEERFSRGTGVVALFAGPSGTGKTLAAEVVANDAGMDVYRVDLSTVVSKYVGETEENLERVFDAASGANAVLLFDEADAVFGERAGVSDATDRYANVEVNYLLQRIESYDGVVLLTTNNESHIDDAFKRRIHQTVAFERPDEAARREIWRITFPADTPTAELDYDFLASLELTGGNIRNVAQTAAVLAADDGGVVRMRHVVEAARRELDKLGQLLDPTEFGEYQRFLTRESADRNGSDPPAETPRANGADVAGAVDGESRTGQTREASGGDATLPAVDGGEGGDGGEDRSGDGDDGPDRSGDGDGPKPSVSGDPKRVVERFFGHLDVGDGDEAHALYHSGSSAREFSPRELSILERNSLSVGEFERVRTEADRVVLRFVQRLDGTTETLEYELRPEDGDWRIFAFRETGAAR